MLILKLAWRNVWRNWRRTILTILAIFFATLLTVVSRSIQFGTYSQNIKTAVELFSGYIQIQKVGFQQNPSISKSFPITKELKSIIDTDENIISYAPRITGNGLISFKQNTFGTLLFGISPTEESRTTMLPQRIQQGSFLSGKFDELVLGNTLLKNLNANIGDTIVILSSGADGSMGNLKFVIVGTLSFGSPELDAMSALINIEAADELMSMYGKVNMLAIKLNDISNITQTIERFSKLNKNPNLTALGWSEILPELKQSIELDDASNFIFMLLLIIVIAFGILNTVLMSITERFREFGILLALGTKNFELVKIVFIEVLIIIIIGITAGNVASHIINYYYYHNPIYFTGDFGAIYEQYGFLPALYFSLDPQIYITMSAQIFIISIITFIFPAYKIFKLEALKGIRYT